MSPETFDEQGFYRQWPPRYEKATHLHDFWFGVECGWHGRERNPDAPPPLDPADDLAYRHGLSVGRKLREQYRGTGGK